MSALLGFRGDLLLKGKNWKWEPGNFYLNFKKESPSTHAHLALETLEKNQQSLSMDSKAIQILQAAKKVYNLYSHATIKAVHNILVNENVTAFGGGYVSDQRDTFHFEIKQRVFFIKRIPSYLISLFNTCNEMRRS
jgi:hypothetical protein